MDRIFFKKHLCKSASSAGNKNYAPQIYRFSQKGPQSFLKSIYKGERRVVEV